MAKKVEKVAVQEVSPIRTRGKDVVINTGKLTNPKVGEQKSLRMVAPEVKKTTKNK